jgi:ABC-type spermidine/putrescine transport system permease subunit II
MTRLQRSRALRWLCTLATVAALVVVLFPVYAVVVGSFESTDYPLQWQLLLAAPRCDARQLPDRHPSTVR